ncbi:MAG: hypothetical protein IH836_03350 [Proteobacteria bacterium]|nr:hypothetical protein [Pseudomonadota bacterium]
MTVKSALALLENLLQTFSTAYIHIGVLHCQYFHHTPQGGTEVHGGHKWIQN